MEVISQKPMNAIWLKIAHMTSHLSCGLYEYVTDKERQMFTVRKSRLAWRQNCL